MGLPNAVRERAHARDESGFTLVEAVVSLFVLGIIFTALAAAAMGSIRASMNSRAEQQAIDFATEALERARQAEYYSLGHDSADIVADTVHVNACGPSWCFNPGDGAEPLVISAGGSVNPHTEVIASDVNNGVNFSVSTYVTTPAGTSADYKRVTVVTRWSVAGNQRERMTSSLVTATTRGLPIPLFALETASSSQSINAGADAVFRIEMTNQGAPDRWDLTVDTGTWTFWRDNGDNILCQVQLDCGPGVIADTPLTDGDDPGTDVDTGRLDPTSTIVFWAVRDGASNGTVGDYWTDLTARAVSVDHEAVAAGVGVKKLSLLTKVTNGTVTETPGPVTPTPTVPSAVIGLSVTVGDGQLTANWGTPSQSGTAAISDYRIEYRRATDLVWVTESDTSTALTQVLAGLINGTEYDVRVAAVSSVGTGAYASTLGTPTTATSYIPPSMCASTAPSSLPSATASSKYTLRDYRLHNRSGNNPSWPGTGAPPPSSTAVQGVPLSMVVDAPQFGSATSLPAYSVDVASDPGRVIASGGSFTSANSDTTRFVDWRTNVAGKQYSGNGVITFWVAPASGATGTGFSLTAQLYRSTATDTVMDSTNTDDLVKTGSPKRSQPVTVSSGAWCGGANNWQKVAIQLPISMKNPLSASEYLGVRLWNSAGGSFSTRVRIAYDIDDDTVGRGFRAALTLPEK